MARALAGSLLYLLPGHSGIGADQAGSIGQPGHAAALLVHGGQQTGPGCCLKSARSFFNCSGFSHSAETPQCRPPDTFFSPCRSARSALCYQTVHWGPVPRPAPRTAAPPFPAETWQQAVPLPGQSGLLPRRSRQQQSRRQQHSSCPPDDFSHERHLLFLSV